MTGCDCSEPATFRLKAVDVLGQIHAWKYSCDRCLPMRVRAMSHQTDPGVVVDVAPEGNR